MVRSDELRGRQKLTADRCRSCRFVREDQPEPFVSCHHSLLPWPRALEGRGQSLQALADMTRKGSDMWRAIKNNHVGTMADDIGIGEGTVVWPVSFDPNRITHCRGFKKKE